MSGTVGNNTNRGSGIVKAAVVGADAIDGSNIADDAIDSEHYTDGSIDNAHLADDAVNSDELAAGAVDLAHMSSDSVDSPQYVDGSIDEAHIADNAVTLAKMAGGTDGNIISYDASGDPVAIATGSDGQVLTSTGAGSPPAFEAVAAGGVWTLIGTQTASSDTSLTQTGLDTSLYTKHLIILSGFTHSATSFLEFLWGPSGGVETSGYSTDIRSYAQNSDTGIDGTASHDNGVQTHMALDQSSTGTSDYHDVEIGLYHKSGGASHCFGCWMRGNNRGIFGGTCDATGATTQIRVEVSTGNIVAGRMTVWGLGHA